MKFIYCVLCFFLAANMQAQQSNQVFDDRLLEVFNLNELEHMKVNKPFLFQRYQFFLDNGYFVTNMNNKSSNTIQEISLDSPKFNILKLLKNGMIKAQFNQPSYYRIKGTTKVLVLLSERGFTKKLNQHLKR